MTQDRFRHDTDLRCHLMAQQVNGCSITPDYARLDFNIGDQPGGGTHVANTSEIAEVVVTRIEKKVRDHPPGGAAVCPGGNLNASRCL